MCDSANPDDILEVYKFKLKDNSTGVKRDWSGGVSSDDSSRLDILPLQTEAAELLSDLKIILKRLPTVPQNYVLSYNMIFNDKAPEGYHVSTTVTWTITNGPLA